MRHHHRPRAGLFGVRSSAPPKRTWLRPTAVTASALLALQAATLVSLSSGNAFAVQPASASPSAGTESAQEPAAATGADSEASALLTARLRGHRIEVLSERTDRSTTWALPSGQLQTETYAGPTRVQRDGQWRDIDTSLTDTGADLAPKTAAADVTVSDGGDTNLASVSKGPATFGLGWQDRLPAPDVKDDTASYDLGSGQTLRVSALAQGFSEDIVLDKRPATADEAVSYRIPLRLDGLKLSQATSGHLLLKSDDGKLVAEAPAPMMWDSSKNSASGESDNVHRVASKIETAADGSQSLVLTPDAGFLADAEYPVTVDPTSTLAVTTDTWVQNPDYTDSQVSSEELKSGTYDGGTDTARSYLQFDVSRFKGKHITDTNLALYSYYSASCSTAGAGTQVRQVTSSWSSSSVTWGAQPSTTTTGAVTNKAALGWSSDCPGGTMNFDIDAIVQSWAAGSANYGLQIRGADEKDSLTWRRFRSANYVSGDNTVEPHLTVTYNSYPAVPTATAITPSQVNAYNGSRYVTSLTPTLSATVTDPDGSATKAQFEITADPASADTTYTYTGTSASVASGSTAKLAVPAANAFPAGTHLRYRVRAYDGTDYGSWTGYTAFVLNTAKPVAPTISCDTYAQNGWTARAASAVSCTIDTTSTDGAGYDWGLDDASAPNKKLDTTNGSGGDAQTVSIAPADGWHTLYARTFDSGGNFSTATTAYSFGVGTDGAAILSPRDGDTTARRLTLATRGLTSYTGATWQYRRGETDAWHTVPAADVAASGNAVAGWPVPVTGGTAAELVWNVVKTLPEDGVIQLRAALTDGSTTGYSQTVEATLDRDAGTAPTAAVGPGTVNELTGDYTLTATDAAAFAVDAERTFSSRANGNDTEGQAQIFGPGWVSSVSAESSAYTQLRKTSATSVELLSGDGGSVAFTATSGGGWKPQDDSADLKLTGSTTGTSFTLTDTDANTTVFAKAAGQVPTWSLSSSASAVVDSTVTVASETVASGSTTLARPKYVISPTGAVKAATCQAAPATKGCRVLEFVYASSTTATSSAPGDRAGQVSALRLWATGPGASAATAETVASYAYDANGRLAQVWDPRVSPALKTAYTYDTDGRVSTLTPPGELPWRFTYGSAGSASTAGAGMLLKASRAALTEGSAHTTSGTATTTVVYDVPLSGANAPHQMGAATVATWGQSEAPTDATAVFPADSVPSSSVGGELTSSSYDRAAVTYIDAAGAEIDSASPGGAITTTEHDVFGNVTFQLSAANRELALSSSSDELTGLGLADLSTADRAGRLATVAEYSADGTHVDAIDGPLHQVTLVKELTGSTSESTLAAGSVVPARTRTTFTYDENRPAGAAVSGLLTSKVTGAAIAGYAGAGADSSTATYVYDWATGQQKSATGDPDTDVVSTYDSVGRVATTRTAGSTGSDADALNYTYYSATATGTCASAQWDGLLCRTAPAAAITAGAGNPSEAVTTVYTYDRWGRTATKTETANGVSRTTTTTVDGAGRVVGTAVTGGTGTAVAPTTLTYDQGTGRVVKQTSDGKATVQGYDDLGRQISYDDGSGNVATTRYDILDRPAGRTDSAPSSVSYAYDTAGDLSALTDSVAGSFSGTYDADGTLTSEALPGGYTLTVDTDPTGQTTARTYTTSDGTTVASDTAGYTVDGRRAGHTQTDGTTVRSDYAYDGSGRLVRASDTAATGCTTRAYTFDANSNRTALTTSSDACDGSDASTATATYSYDSSDRLVNSGYAYDAFGRTSTSGSTALTYYTDDLVASTTDGAGRTTWSRDALGRLAVQTASSQASDGTWSAGTTTTSHYGDASDSPSWSVSGSTVARYVHDLTGAFAAATTASGDVVLQASDLHGNVTVQQPLDTSAASTVRHYDEYGNVLADSSRGEGYGWLGAQQRASTGGLTLMGVRLYDATTGRFLSRDGVYGGSSNAYDYCSGNPVTCLDLGGLSKHNYNKHGWHWWGYEMDMTNARGWKVVNRFNQRAATTAVIAAMIGLYAWATGVGALAAALGGVVSAYYWWLSSKLQTTLYNHPHRGVKLKIKFGYPNVTKE
ncbi:DNRLRE domain-containing protein [Streptomyces sp. NPDC008125]|uniref:DNRLRE domain-containing protein n=1 Tax=Streptomyces sp. NPDC008125 TaxID=3364811 RepID=UPI0036EBCED2